MSFLLFIVLLSVIFFIYIPKLLPSLIKWIVSVIIKPSDEGIQLKSELQVLKKELKGINMVDEFAKYAKLERKINKISDQLKVQNNDKSSLHLKIKVGVNAVFHITQVVYFVSLIYTYRQEPLLMLPDEWFWPISSVIAFQTGISGAVSITFWLLVCRVVVQKAASCLAT